MEEKKKKHIFTRTSMSELRCFSPEDLFCASDFWNQKMRHALHHTTNVWQLAAANRKWIHSYLEGSMTFVHTPFTSVNRLPVPNPLPLGDSCWVFCTRAVETIMLTPNVSEWVEEQRHSPPANTLTIINNMHTSLCLTFRVQSCFCIMPAQNPHHTALSERH